MKFTPESILTQTFVGRTLVSSDFHKADEDTSMFDSMGNEVDFSVFNPFGSVITKAEFGFSEGREDAGLLLYFEGWSEPFFFYNNETLETELIVYES